MLNMLIISFSTLMEVGRTNERPGTDHVISVPMRGIKKCTFCANVQTDGHGNSMAESAQWG